MLNRGFLSFMQWALIVLFFFAIFIIIWTKAFNHTRTQLQNIATCMWCNGIQSGRGGRFKWAPSCEISSVNCPACAVFQEYALSQSSMHVIKWQKEQTTLRLGQVHWRVSGEQCSSSSVVMNSIVLLAKGFWPHILSYVCLSACAKWWPITLNLGLN